MDKCKPTVFNMAMEPDGDFDFDFKWMLTVTDYRGARADIWSATLSDISFFPSFLKLSPQAVAQAAKSIVKGRAFKKYRKVSSKAAKADAAASKLGAASVSAPTREELAALAAEAGLDISKMPFFDLRSKKN